MANKERKLTQEEIAELEKAKATILRLQGPPETPPSPAGPPVLRRIRVLLHGVTWNEDKKEHYDNTCKAVVRDPKTGRNEERIIDRSIVEVEAGSFDLACALAWDLFRKSWGIRMSDFTPKFAEVRDLTEDERRNPPEFVMQIPDHILTGVPAPTVLPIRADGSFNRPVPAPNVAVG